MDHNKSDAFTQMSQTPQPIYVKVGEMIAILLITLTFSLNSFLVFTEFEQLSSGVPAVLESN